MGLCTAQAPVGLSNDLSCEAGSLSCCCPNPHGHFQSEVCLSCAVCFTPHRLSGLSVCECGAVGSATHRSACPVLRHSESGPLGLSVRKCGAAGSVSGHTACPVHPTLRQSQSRHGNESSPPWLPVSTPPTGLDECFFFNSLVVRLP